MLLGEIAQGLHDGELNVTVRIIQVREKNVDRGEGLRVFEETSGVEAVVWVTGL